jgi:hypothetical protein
MCMPFIGPYPWILACTLSESARIAALLRCNVSYPSSNTTLLPAKPENALTYNTHLK